MGWVIYGGFLLLFWSLSLRSLKIGFAALAHVFGELLLYVCLHVPMNAKEKNMNCETNQVCTDAS